MTNISSPLNSVNSDDIWFTTDSSFPWTGASQSSNILLKKGLNSSGPQKWLFGYTSSHDHFSFKSKKNLWNTVYTEIFMVLKFCAIKIWCNTIIFEGLNFWGIKLHNVHMCHKSLNFHHMSKDFSRTVPVFKETFNRHDQFPVVARPYHGYLIQYRQQAHH